MLYMYIHWFIVNPCKLTNLENREYFKLKPLPIILARCNSMDMVSTDLDVACVAGGIREQVIFSGGAANLFPCAREFVSGEAASEIPTCPISYGFCLPPTLIIIWWSN